MNDLSPRAKALFATARTADEPLPGAQERVARRLGSRLAVGMALGAGAASAKSAWAVWAPLLKTMTWVSAGTAISLAAWHELRPHVLKETTLTTQSWAPASTTPGSAARREVGVLSDGVVVLGNPMPNLAFSGDGPLAPAASAEGAGLPNQQPAEVTPVEQRSGVARSAPIAEEAEHARAEPMNDPTTLPAANFPENRSAARPGANELTSPVRIVPPPGTPVIAPARHDTTLAPPGNSSQVAANSIAAEAERLREVQHAIRDGQAARALESLELDDARFTRGALAQERSAARVQALCALGERDRAQAEVRRFEQRWPRSVLLARVRAQCP